MLDVIVLCEGHTEREFCRNVVAPHLAARGIALAGTLPGKPLRRHGGVPPWPSYENELLRLAKERADRHVAVLVDYYAMPESWPGRKDAPAKPVAERGRHVECKLKAALEKRLHGRFHPCVQLHEFESLLFVDPEISALSIAVGGGRVSHNVAEQMKDIKMACGGLVEQINDGPETAPSKRLINILPGYDKVAWGVTAAADVPLEALRAGCPWLNLWLEELEGLAGAGT